jgi:hypothetical protein
LGLAPGQNSLFNRKKKVGQFLYLVDWTRMNGFGSDLQILQMYARGVSPLRVLRRHAWLTVIVIAMS